MRNAKKTGGFSLVELLIVIAVIGILAAVLIPNLLGARKRGNDTAAASVARNVATAAAAMQVKNPSNVISRCTFYSATGTTRVYSGGTASNSAHLTVVASPKPVSNVSCATNGSSVTVTYAGGSTNTYAAKIQQ